MIDEPLAQPGQPRRRSSRGVMYLLALLLFGGVFGYVILQGLRRCSDLTESGQLLWGDLRPLALPLVFFLIGLSLLGLRALLLLRHQWRLASISQLSPELAQSRHFILLSLAILALFFGIIFTCSQLALMGYPPCSLEVAINPLSTADYGPWSTDVFQPLDPKILTQIALDAADEVALVPAANRPPLNVTVAVDQVTALQPEAVQATATAEAVAVVPTAQAAQTQTTVAQTAVASTAEALLTATATLEPTQTVTGTLTSTPTGTLSATPTATITGTLSVTPTGTLSATPIPTVTGILSATPTGTLSATPTATITGTLSATPLTTATAMLSQTATVTQTLTWTPTVTLTHTATFTNTAISTATLIPTVFVPPTGVPLVPIPTAIPVYTPTSTRTPTLTFTPAITNTPTTTLTPTDTFTPTYTLTPSATSTPFGLGSIYREYWFGINGNSVSQLTGSTNYPNSPNNCDLLTSFDAPMNWADNYGTRMRGYLYPPTTGLYTFWIASDDNSELWLSTDMNPANRVLIASVPGWTNPQQWNKYPVAQQSAAMMLTAGQGYYIDALHKEGGGLDNLSVAWQGPGILQTIIPGGFLAPFATTCIFIPFVPTATYTPVVPNTPTFTPSPTPSPTPTFTPSPTFTPTSTSSLSADVYVIMTVSNPAPNVGDTIQYNITYGNLGGSTATAVQMLSPLPVQVDYISHTGGTFDSMTGNWTLPDLLNGQNGNTSITVTVRAEATGLTIPNSIVIMAAEPDPNPGNNNASTSITVP